MSINRSQTKESPILRIASLEASIFKGKTL